MRLYPPTWLITRTVTKQVTLSGVLLPAGQTMVISPWVLHRDDRNFESASQYRPERWFNSQASRNHAYMPFGYGPHACPGNNLAHVLMRSVVKTVLAGGAVIHAVGPMTPDARTTLLPNGVRMTIRTEHAVSLQPSGGAR